ncbi:hypothetical protein OIO90_003847 [Microbotryomycetes sp. JL221]|nr:hypothetical protein OIO90_003847 [Microbotryomycetes sp. JL221]
MKVVGLLSGGKDSVYNLLHTIINGHEPVAVASLGPPSHKDELDSYMYQTVGHSGLKMLAQALGLPLFVHTIQGTAVEQGSEYGSRATKVDGGTKGDETEDLVTLLTKVKQAMPQVQGVACGAILSNYQRVRVEHVCSRLGLTPIAYLWERNQAELLSEMVDAGMDSVLVKVAGAGLRVDHLGKSLAQMQPILHSLNEKYQLHVCGEGGEYETFTVDCPLFRKRVEFDKVSTIVSDSNPFATVAHLHIDECHLVDKPNHPQNETFDEMRQRLKSLVQVPPTLDKAGKSWYEAIRNPQKILSNPIDEMEQSTSLMQKLQVSQQELDLEVVKPTIHRQQSWVSFGDILAQSQHDNIEDEVKQCFEKLEQLLESQNSNLLDVAHLTVYLSSNSMSLFPRINAVYSTYFGSSPPTRACVSINLPRTKRIKLEGVAFSPQQNQTGNNKDSKTRHQVLLNTTNRKALHVQSLSYWAPANIGPYSQCVTVSGQDGNRMFMAGQIPLEPSTLTLKTTLNENEQYEQFARDVALSLQHVSRVKRAATEQRWKGCCEGGICWIEPTKRDKDWSRKVLQARTGFKMFNIDSQFDDDDDRDYEALRHDLNNDGCNIGPSMLYVQAEELPRGASVEWQLSWATGDTTQTREQDDEEQRSDDEGPDKSVRVYDNARQCFRSRTSTNEVTGQIQVTQIAPRSLGPTVIDIVAIQATQIETNSTRESDMEGPSKALNHHGIVSVKAFHLPHVSSQTVRRFAAQVIADVTPESVPALSLRLTAKLNRDNMTLHS